MPNEFKSKTGSLKIRPAIRIKQTTGREFISWLIG
jgi:hypothetical protein